MRHTDTSALSHNATTLRHNNLVRRHNDSVGLRHKRRSA